MGKTWTKPQPIFRPQNGRAETNKPHLRREVTFEGLHSLLRQIARKYGRLRLAVEYLTTYAFALFRNTDDTRQFLALLLD